MNDELSFIAFALHKFTQDEPGIHGVSLRWRLPSVRMPRALITGITGQDGQHLAELLRGKGYDIFGLFTGQHDARVESLFDKLPYVEPMSGDLRDLPSLIAAVEQAQPDEVYNLGAISFVALSFRQPELTAEITGLGVQRMLEAVRVV